MQDCPSCPRSQTDPANIDPVLQSQMDARSSAHEKLEFDQLLLFSKILKQIIHYVFSLWCRGQSANEPTGKSVYDTMTAHCGKDWVKYVL